MKETSNVTQMPVIYVPHGGGPMPLMGDASHTELISFLESLYTSIVQPQAILVISAHWEQEQACVSGAAQPEMIFDYYGFPSETYGFSYPAPGEPELAKQIVDLITGCGIAAHLDARRGFDHGTFVPLMLMYPQADIPVVQLSLLNSLDPAAHIALGKSIASLREKGVLIVGSGMSFHNMQAFFSGHSAVKHRSEQFDNWLTQTLTDTELTQAERQNRLESWKNAPEAQFSHPREEHLLPLHVCFGAAYNGSLLAQRNFNSSLFNAKISGFIWF